MRERHEGGQPVEAAGRAAAGPVVLGTLSSRVEPEAERLAIQSALEAGVPLLVVNAVPMPACPRTLVLAGPEALTFPLEEDYVLDGTFEIRIGDELHGVGPGGFAYVRRGTVHNFRNTADTPSRILVGFTPGGIEGFFRESGRPATDDGPAPPVDQDEIDRTMAAAPKYGLQAVAFDD